MSKNASSGSAARAAQHCSELLSRSVSPPERGDQFRRFSEKLAMHIQTLLTRLCDSKTLDVQLSSAAPVKAAEFFALAEGNAVNAFHALQHERRGVLVSTSVGALVAQFERLLGGSGDIDPDCTLLPASAANFVSRFHGQFNEGIRLASDGQSVSLSAESTNAADISFFPENEHIWVVTLSVQTVKGSPAWQILVAICESSFEEIVGSRVASPASGRSIAERGFARSPIADMHLPLRAVLVEMDVAISRVAGLEVGSVLPIGLSRKIPLLVDATTIAAGTIGEVDDRVALQISDTFFSGSLSS